VNVFDFTRVFNRVASRSSCSLALGDNAANDEDDEEDAKSFVDDDDDAKATATPEVVEAMSSNRVFSVLSFLFSLNNYRMLLVICFSLDESSKIGSESVIESLRW